MKRFAYYIACCSLVALFSCTHDDIDEVLAPVGDGKITIQSTLDDMVITRAEVDDTTPERTITHIDIFAIDESGNIDYYERNVTGNNEGNAENGAGTLTLGVSRRAKDANDNFIFEQGVNYKFILVANAVATKADMQEATTLSDLEKLVQDDSFETSFVGGDSSNEGATGSTPSMSRQTLLHLSGTSQGNNPDKETPKTFLMDAVATDSDNNEKWVVNPASSTVPNLNLSAEFKRAASKIIVNIEQGADVEFRTQLDSESAQYDFYKLPASTFVLPNESKLVNIQLINTAPMKPNKETFIWKYEDASAENPRNQNSIQIIGYAYSHSWSDVDLTNETSLILNIPMMWNMDDSDDHSKEAEAPRSWYKVPLSQGKKFERNKCYIVNIEINAVGAATRSTAIELRDIEYKTLDWQDVGINVGDTSENPKYLILNTDLVEMYNVNLDNTSLEFSSSSAITSVTLKDVYKQNADGTFTAATDSHSAYYINKFGIYTDLSSTVRSTISATAEQNVLNGGILILSPILNTKDEERRLAIEALGEAPTPPTEPNNTGKPNPTDYLGDDKGYPLESERPQASREWYNRTYTIYRYNETTNTFQSRTDKCTYSYSNWDYSWTNGSWTDIDNPDEYDTALSTWLASHPEYQKYLEEMARYDAYQAALTAIQNSETSGETHYNTIRYLEFEVKNAEGLTATFRVMQYPVIYITNQQGAYSYRDDFINSDGEVVTYELWKNKDNSNNNYTRCSYGNNGWSYNTGSGSSSLFCSKYVSSTNTSGSNQGKSEIEYYYWSSTTSTGHSSVWDGSGTDNARMYHVKVTATSKEYIVGRPRIVDEDGKAVTNVENGYTNSDAENAKLVSPSFMIASQLGATQSPGEDDEDMPIAADHCRYYVEVASDGTVYNDWRLPTAAEIDIIIALQKKGEAIDVVLAGESYWCASGIKETNLSGASGTGRVRCVRDAY